MTTDFRGLWLALAVLTALVIGLIAGGLFYLDSRRVPTAIGNGGIAFVPRSVPARSLRLPRVVVAEFTQARGG